MKETRMKAGTSYGNRASVLRRPITAGGFGRPLTSTEARDLRRIGWSIGRGYIVVRQVSDIPWLGIVYRPLGHGHGYGPADIYVDER